MKKREKQKRLFRDGFHPQENKQYKRVKNKRYWDKEATKKEGKS